MKKYVFSGGIFNILYIAIKHECQKIFLRTKKKKKKTVKKMPYFFFREILYKLKHKVRLSKTVCMIFHFRFRFVLIKVYIFVQQHA